MPAITTTGANSMALCPCRRTGLKPVVAILSLITLTGCASLSKDAGIDAVSALTKERIKQPVQRLGARGDKETLGANVQQLLVAPLTADSAVQVALLNNRGFQTALAELGVAEADLVQAGRIRNPSVSFARLRGGDDVEIERSIMFDLVGLLTIPLRTDIERGRFEQAKLQAASNAVRLAADVRRVYFAAVAAQQSAVFMEQTKESAEAGAELARRMAQVGNWSKLDQARQQALYADTTAQLARARHNAVSAREQLTRLLGLWGDKVTYRLPDRLPDLPAQRQDLADIEAQAMRQRLDVQIAKHDAQAKASALGLTRATGFINVLHAGYANRSESGAPRANGYEVELELPLFDWGSAKTAKAEALYMQSVHRTADIAIRARSQAREAYSAYHTTYDLARHYRDEIVPLRKKISDEMLLRYNGMLVGVFELLADARDQIGSVNAAIEAQRDYWIAETDLQMAINGNGGATTEPRSQAAAPATQGH
jgi:outer membrane protein TolC